MNDLIARTVDELGRGTAAQLARDTKVSAATVSHWVSGAISPERHRWADIEASLGLPAGALERAHMASVASRVRPTVKRHAETGSDDKQPAAVTEAIQMLGDELELLRSEIAALRIEVDELRGERRGPVQSSGQARRGSKPKKESTRQS